MSAPAATRPQTAPPLAFPDGFVWGCGTSPTQVEGDTVNEWGGFVARDGTTPDDGPNHWRRYRFDFRCLGDMNLSAYRIGFDWGRLQPGPREPFDRHVALRYMEMLAELRGHGVEPYLTLFHFACPRWLAEMGGWLHPDAPDLFADFAERLADITDGEVRWWITHNEPVVYAFMAYVRGNFVPGRRHRPDLCYRVLKQLATAHALAYDRIKARHPDARVGITKHCKRFLPLRPWHPLDRLSAGLCRTGFDRWGLSSFVEHRGRSVADFVGVNYYGRMRMKGLNGVSPLSGFGPEELQQHGCDCDDMWEQDPGGLIDCLTDVAERTQKPIYITENGVATADETLRQRYLREHLTHCHAALQRGIDVRGYFYWSLMDNFEWSEGLSKRFGLLSVDYTRENRRRELRPAARLYARIAGANALDA